METSADTTPLGVATLGYVSIPQDALTPELDALTPAPHTTATDAPFMTQATLF